MSSLHTPAQPCHWCSLPAAALDVRSAARLARLLLGAVLARCRQTVAAWVRTAGMSDAYNAVAAAGLARTANRPLLADAPPADPGRA